ncbi:DUF1835 domain-containing protein [Muriicola sp. Z0-33]|uniref:DUF1835 domain-containing protein n=1 Tax=Muriicola sp. Z0-33 TaxID=2816957 RepID=UPI00223729E5|nr:DUF1835 domain-containing protein [Muriicola sp. Z0-33]MCW5515323.1 DUF1835 domain-containing protein [Muriicola sp. Z0-33]
MSSQLHITNGDSFTQKLESLQLKGEIITWREMLCEGKTETNVGSESFWKTRFDFLHKNYKVSKSWFVEKTLKEYRSLCNHKQQDQIILWFEYDLFCQINMLAVLSWLKTYRRDAEISLVCSGDEDETDKLYGLNELSNEQLLDLYENRKVLSRSDIEYADYVWQLYCSDNPIRLENLTDFNNYQFDYLGDAVKAHLKRFPSIKNGLNAIENKVLEVAAEKKPRSKKAFLNNVLQDQGLYGFGDSQYDRVITNLKPLFTSFNPVRLSKKGKEILDRKTSYYSLIKDNEAYLGGALKYNYLYNTDSDRILKL